MKLDEFLKYVIWIFLLILVLIGLFFTLKRIGIM